LLPTSGIAGSCESLSDLALPDTMIIGSQTVAAGAFTQPGGRGPNGAAVYQSLPAFCRVQATLKPTADSNIQIEVWLPAAGWNGKFQAVGNGGWAGVISYREMAEALQRGYATASTDTGHTGGRGEFAFGHPEKLIDFGWRSEHEMTVKAKAIVSAFYGSAPKYSYWNGCSTGGRQGLKEAQQFPNDYDGIIAGAPANRTALALWVAFAELKEPASFIPASKYPLVHQAALTACDARDGLKDGLIGDPASCKFDPQVLLCKGPDNGSCLTKAQVEAARKIYSPAANPRTGQAIFPSLVPGTELGWGVLGAGPDPSAVMLDHYKYVVFKDPNWNWRTFDFDRDVVRADAPSCITAGAIPTLPPSPPFSTTTRLSTPWAEPRKLQTTSGYSWSPEWDTAAAAKAPTFSTKWTPSNNGWKKPMPPIR
jgi:feruloyl esterase